MSLIIFQQAGQPSYARILSSIDELAGLRNCVLPAKVYNILMLRKYPEHPQNSEVRQVLIKIDKDMRRELRRGDGLTGLIVQSLGYVALGSGFHIPAHAIRVEEEPDTPAE